MRLIPVPTTIMSFRTVRRNPSGDNVRRYTKFLMTKEIGQAARRCRPNPCCLRCCCTSEMLVVFSSWWQPAICNLLHKFRIGIILQPQKKCAMSKVQKSDILLLWKKFIRMENKTGSTTWRDSSECADRWHSPGLLLRIPAPYICNERSGCLLYPQVWSSNTRPPGTRCRSEGNESKDVSSNRGSTKGARFGIGWVDRDHDILGTALPWVDYPLVRQPLSF